MQSHIPHGQAGHVCSGDCKVPRASFLFNQGPALPTKVASEVPKLAPAVSLAAAAAAEYSCEHPAIQSRDGLTQVMDGIDFSSDRALRPSLHNAGHFELSEALLPRGRGLIADLHQSLTPVFSLVAAQDSGLSAEQASLTAMILRLTATDLMDKTAGLPDFKPLEEAWGRIFNTAPETVVGEVIANLMAIYKKSDDVNKTAGTAQSLSVNFARVVMSNVREKIFQESESPIRKWFVQSLPSAYYPNLNDLYGLMLRHGSGLEVDVALNALDFFAANPNAGGDRRSIYCQQYKSWLSGVLSGNGNPNINDAFLMSVAKYGREISYLDKAREITARI